MGEPKVLVTRETGELVEQSEWSRSDIELIKEQVARDATDQELRYFLMVCKATGLDPRLRQIYFIKRWDSSAGKKVGAVQSSIDGIRSVAEDSGEYAGQDAPILEFHEHDKNKVRPVSATVTVYRMVEGERVPFTHTAYWDEYVQLTKDGEPTSFWLKMPKNQLAKCAEAGSLRKAFPRKLQKIYVHEEMGQADNQLPAPSISKGQSKGKPAAPSGEIPKPLRSIKSKFGSEKKPSKCGFCGEYHVLEDDPIVQHPGPGELKEKWGHVRCYEDLFSEAESEKSESDFRDGPKDPSGESKQTDDPVRDDVIENILELERKIALKDKAFKIDEARLKALDTVDFSQATNDALVQYMESLG